MRKVVINDLALLYALLFTLLLALTALVVVRGMGTAYSAEPPPLHSHVAEANKTAPEPTAIPVVIPSPQPTKTPKVAATARPTARPIPEPTATFDASRLDAVVLVDTEADVRPISPLIYGISLPESRAYIAELRPTFISWGGNPTSRYNWRAGNLWNGANDYLYYNGNYGMEGAIWKEFLRNATDVKAATRLSVPTLGWVAKDHYSCSFRDANGECYVPDFDCRNPLAIADPHETSIRSTPADIAEWMQAIIDSGYPLDYVALDNEPELWGFTHFDVHPECVTYQEIVDNFIAYGEAVRSVYPDAKIVGPNTCCWHFYFQSAAGTADKLKHGGKDYLPWFLEQMRRYEERTGVRLLDVLDIHYYPEGLYNVWEDGSHIPIERLQAPRLLWDETYVDPSWVNDTVMLIPRVREWIDTEYPGTAFGISEWNFGADDTMNGALAAAEALGIFGRYGVHYAAYWDFPKIDTPTFDAFKLFTSYDNNGGRFGDLSVSVTVDDVELRSFASVDSVTGNLHIMLINQSESDAKWARVGWAGFSAENDATIYRVDAARSANIITKPLATAADHAIIELPAYSITHIVLPAE